MFDCIVLGKKTNDNKFVNQILWFIFHLKYLFS